MSVNREIMVSLEGVSLSNSKQYQEEIQALLEKINVGQLRTLNKLILAGKLPLEESEHNAKKHISALLVNETKKALKKYGEVAVCREYGNRFEVSLINCNIYSFYTRMTILPRMVQSYVGSAYPNIDVFVNEKQTFQLVLKP